MTITELHLFADRWIPFITLLLNYNTLSNWYFKVYSWAFFVPPVGLKHIWYVLISYIVNLLFYLRVVIFSGVVSGCFPV